jgi:hypothetical protein
VSHASSPIVARMLHELSPVVFSSNGSLCFMCFSLCNGLSLVLTQFDCNYVTL